MMIYGFSRFASFDIFLFLFSEFFQTFSLVSKGGNANATNQLTCMDSKMTKKQVRKVLLRANFSDGNHQKAVISKDSFSAIA